MGKKTPILVTGSHRSGSTWVGRMLSASPHVAYIHEPFNIKFRVSHNEKPFKHWFEYVCSENSADYDRIFKNIVRFKYPAAKNLRNCRVFRDFAKVVKDQGLCWWYAANNARPLLKDPIAIYSSEWIAEKLAAQVLIVIRHPAAFCSSIKLKEWRFDFNDFLDQPLLMDGYLKEYQDEIRAAAESGLPIIDQAILQWNCIHHTINIFRDRHPDWLFVRHEDLSSAPVEQFRAIFERLGLEFTSKVETELIESSGEHNPVEQIPGKENLRNSKENIRNWQTRLSDEEVQKIKSGTSRVWPEFYSDADWC